MHCEVVAVDIDVGSVQVGVREDVVVVVWSGVWDGADNGFNNCHFRAG